MNPLLVEFGEDPDWGFVVDEVAFDHGLAIGVLVRRRAEDLGRVERRRRRQPNPDRIEVVDHAAVLRDIIPLGAEGEFVLAHLLVEVVPAMGLVDDDAVVAIDRDRRGRVARVEQVPHHPLYCRYVKAGIRLRRQVAYALHVVNLVEALEVLELHVLKRTLGLLGQRRPIDQEENAPKPTGLDQAVDQPERRPGLPCPSCHGEKNLSAPLGNALLGGLDRVELIIAKTQIIGRLGLERGLGPVVILREQTLEALRAVPIFERVRMVRSPPRIQEPDP